MRALLIVFNQTGKGTYWRALHFGRRLAQRGHCVTLMAMSQNARLWISQQEADGVRVIETPDLLPGSLRSGWDAWDALCRVLWLRGRAFDLVHAFEARPVVLLPALAAQRRGAKLVMDWCDWLGRGGSVEERPNPVVRAMLRPVETFFEERFRTCADGTTVINTFLRERAIGLGVRPESILLIRNGSTVEVQPVERLAARLMLGLPPEATLIGFVGGIYARDAGLMAAALNRVRQRAPGARLVLAGYFNRRIESMLDDPASVLRTGTLPYEQVYHYLAACDVCWLPLRDSGANRGRWPLKLNDYMTVGRPVVATAVGDLPDVIRQHQLGVVTRDNADEFASATVDLLADAERRIALGQAARRAAEQVFSWDRLADELEMFYHRILETP